MLNSCDSWQLQSVDTYVVFEGVVSHFLLCIHRQYQDNCRSLSWITVVISPISDIRMICGRLVRECFP